MNIEILNNVATVTYKQNQRTTSKIISLETLSELFKTTEGIQTPILPVGCRNYLRNGKKHVLCLEVPPAKRMFHYKNSSGKTIVKGKIAMPRFLVFMTLLEEKNGFRFNSSLFRIIALAEPLLSDKDKLYSSPLPNTHDRASVCWGRTFDGNNQALLIDELAKAYRFIDIYFSGDFNTDITIKFSPSTTIQRPEDLYREMLTADVFDKKYLKGFVSGPMTINSIMKDLAK